MTFLSAWRLFKRSKCECVCECVCVWYFTVIIMMSSLTSRTSMYKSFFYCTFSSILTPYRHCLFFYSFSVQALAARSWRWYKERGYSFWTFNMVSHCDGNLFHLCNTRCKISGTNVDRPLDFNNTSWIYIHLCPIPNLIIPFARQRSLRLDLLVLVSY